MSNELSRRDFLHKSALSTAGVVVSAGGSQSAAESGVATVGPGSVSIEISVNGIDRNLQVEPRMTLAEALRGPLELSGTKIACNRGACSACTVLMDGLPVCACMVLAIEVGGRSVTTIEGLATGDVLHPVQAAFVEHDAVQCGFCTPGMVLSCAALLERMPDPGPGDIREAISGHLCRCGTYPHVVAAVRAAASSRGG
jgi:xanthine dehydrogenase YagT iron-sulfur-binding subunit